MARIFDGKARGFYYTRVGNPRLDVTDIERLATITHIHGLPLIVDNTVETAFLVQPIKLGADIMVQYL